MTKLAIKSDKLTSVIERRVIAAGEAGVTANKLMQELSIGRTCVRNHLASLVGNGRAYRVRHRRPNTNGVFHTFHACTAPAAPLGDLPARRDWLQAAFFGPARKEVA